MLLFLDTEFTDFAHPDLISLGLVGEDGRTFYAERHDFRKSTCTAFVRSEVLPLLGRSFAGAQAATYDRETLTVQLRAWFEALPEPATVAFDHFGDWLELNGALRGRMHGTPPLNLGKPMHLLSSVFEHPVFKQASDATFSAEWPQHHALVDAYALRAGYMAWSTATGGTTP